MVNVGFDTVLASLVTLAFLGALTGWYGRPGRETRLPNDMGCAGCLVALLAILLVVGMLIGRALQ